MKPFLQQVACHYFREGGLENICFVFPNRRAQVFFRKHLAALVRDEGRAVLSPGMLSISDFFHTAAGYRKTEKIRLLLVLYECYSELYPGAESLDQFIYWGDVLLSDFGDVDRYMVDPRKLFTNVSDLKNLQDDFSYMTPAQWEAVKKLLRTGPEDSKVRGNFLGLWNILLPLYESFRSRLREKGLSYEGMVCRDLAESLDSRPVRDVFAEAFPDFGRFVFVGLNALNECERRVLGRLNTAGMAEFCWDWSSDMIKDPHNASSFFLKENLSAFPQAFEPDSEEPLEEPSFTVISVPSSVGQAKLLPQILGERPERDDSTGTAVVLPDETLLLPVLHSIPSGWKDVNVTMGYPITSSELYSLVEAMMTAQLHMRRKNGEWYFHFREAGEVISNSVFRAAVGKEAVETLGDIRKQAGYFVSAGLLAGCSPVAASVFTPVITDPVAASESVCRELSLWLGDILDILADRLSGIPDMELEIEFARRCRKAVNVLQAYCTASLMPSTWMKLFQQLVAVEAVPFEGEPLKGLQVMGPLETRTLDFERLVILSCNEGIFPRHSVSASFIPPELRRSFALPTYEHQDAMWAYYFYRMIQRAKEVYLIYDSREGGLRRGEESRFIKQLELHFSKPVLRAEASASVSAAPELPVVVKSDADMERIADMFFSASALQSYLSCPLKFYYGYVRRLKKENEVEESMDAGMIGLALHSSVQYIFGLAPEGKVTPEWLGSVEKDAPLVTSTVRRCVEEQLKSFEVTGRNLVYEDIICRYVRQILRRDRERLEALGAASMTILECEKTHYWDFGPYKFKGTIDRLDTLDGNTLRVVDYKTGRVLEEDVDINEGNAAGIAEAIFSKDSSKRPDIALQIFLYDMFIRKDFPGKEIENSIYGAAGLFVEGVKDIPLCGTFCDLVKGRLRTLLDEIADPSRPFAATEDEGACTYCDFKVLCGK